MTEQELWKQYRRSRSVEDRNRLVVSYMPLMRWHARRVYDRIRGAVRAPAIEDLCTAGSIALIGLVEAWRPEKGARFVTFARCRLPGSMLDFVRDNDHMSRQSRAFERTDNHLRQEFLVQNERPATATESATMMGMGAKRYLQNQKWISAGVLCSISEIGMVKDARREAGVPCDCEESVGLTAMKADSVDFMLRGLTDRERQVVKLYYIDGLKQHEIGVRLGESEANISLIRSAAIKYLQWYLRGAKKDDMAA